MIPIAKPVIEEEEIRAVVEVLKTGNLAGGAKVKEFEEQFSAFCNTGYAVATNSGTSALHTALMASGIGKDDEVIIPDFSFVATGTSVLMSGAEPVFADIKQDSCNINPDNVEVLITPKTRAIIGVHLFGNPCEMNEMKKIAEKHDLILIEDSAQAHGAEYHGKKTGSLGDAGCFSFYATKNMITGEGGMITTGNADIYEKSKKLINHGQSSKYTHDILGYNYRMTDIAAAIGIEQIKKIDGFNELRRKNASYYNDNIDCEGIVKPFSEPYSKHVYHQYAIRVTADFPLSREELMKHLEERGISTAVHYPSCISSQPVFRQYEASTPVSHSVSKEILSLPVHPLLTEKDLEYVCNSINEVI